MSDSLKHECGVAMLRLLKPLEFYKEKYGTSFYGLKKMYLLMEKQRNRGLFENINKRFVDLEDSDPEKLNNIQWLKNNMPFTGELFLGHLRYGTYGGNSIEQCHPFLRQNNWKTRNLALAGNFNMTNVDELFAHLTDLGQHPKEKSDTITIIEKIGHFLDEANVNIYQKHKGNYTKKEISLKIEEELNIQEILSNSSKHWDGGYVMCGLLGHGDAFALRDPSAIRPAYYYCDDEIVVVASERPVIQTTFNLDDTNIREIKRGHALIIKKDGTISEQEVLKPLTRTACSFERIYFSRGNDKDIYNERIRLGQQVFYKVLESINRDIEKTVFSYIPNTAEVSYFGMMKEVDTYLNKVKSEKILALGNNPLINDVERIMSISPRAEKIAVKDAKLRTFITSDVNRDDLVAHVYDITYGKVNSEDNLVMIDDSIVRGTTLKQSILRILDRLGPKKIIVVSSAPQIRYPDCYGIDMAILGDFIAFQAAISLLKDTGQEDVIDNVYKKCKDQINFPKEEMVNHVKDIYNPFSAEQISKKISQILTPKDTRAEVEIIYQGIEDLHIACPNHTGDWYFSGNYPTPGGNKVVTKAFINYVEGSNKRAY